MHFRRTLDLTIAMLVISTLLVPTARSVTISGSRLVEDFSTDTYADYTTTTGFWDLPEHKARAGVVSDAAGVAGKIDFGNGSDGDLTISSDYTFDTSTHPNGFNFKSVTITGTPTIKASGSNALVIRSLTTVNIAAGVTFSLDGGPGSPGDVVSGATAGGAGGTNATCSATGGNGGDATTTTYTDGKDGKLYSGALDAGNGGLGNNNTASGVGSGQNGTTTAASLPSSANFDSTGFICGPGGAGGGGNTTGGAGGPYAAGGGGGGGGGRIRIVSAGAMNISTTISAKGGVSGKGRGNNTTICAGSGAGGSGGSVWLQSLSSVTAAAPSVAAGTGTSNTDCTGAGANPGPGPAQDGVAGATRTDQTGVGLHGTTPAAPNKTYTVQSKGYDLGTLNASFGSAPSITSAANSGSTPVVSFAGSADDSTYSPFTADITTLSGKGYRYLKFQITLVTGAAAGNSPEVSLIAVDYSDIGPSKLDLKLSAGCGTLAGLSDNDSGGPRNTAALAQYLMGWLVFWLLAYRLMRYGFVRKTRRVATM